MTNTQTGEEANDPPRKRPHAPLQTTPGSPDLEVLAGGAGEGDGEVECDAREAAAEEEVQQGNGVRANRGHRRVARPQQREAQLLAVRGRAREEHVRVPRNKGGRRLAEEGGDGGALSFAPKGQQQRKGLGQRRRRPLRLLHRRGKVCHEGAAQKTR